MMTVYRNCLRAGIAITSLYIVYIVVGTAAVLHGWNGRITLPVRLVVRVQQVR